jgi:uncharacterized membrane protein
MNDEPFVPSKQATLATVLLVALAWVLSLAALPFAPGSVPTHWGIDGQPDQWAAPVPGLFIAPAIMGCIAVLVYYLPRIDPRRRNYAAFGSTYTLIQVGLIGFLFVLHLITLAAALGIRIDMNRVITPLVGALLVVLGNVMGKVRPNWFVGFRTPWTLHSPDVWTRTHRFGGRLMVVLGLAMCVAGVALPAMVAFAVTFGGMILLVAAIFVYSYRVWEQLEGSR